MTKEFYSSYLTTSLHACTNEVWCLAPALACSVSWCIAAACFKNVFKCLFVHWLTNTLYVTTSYYFNNLNIETWLKKNYYKFEYDFLNNAVVYGN